MFFKNSTVNGKKSLVYKGWTRPTINWSIECEHQGLSRQEAYKSYTENQLVFHKLMLGQDMGYYGKMLISLAFLGPLFVLFSTHKAMED